MGVSFTPQQQEVIDLRDCNILVSAAAGSGKTAVLTERIVNMISDEEKPVDIDRLLVVTFTSAAAAEMRERIGNGIAKRLEETPGSVHLQRQATLLHAAQITTIDSFCLFLVKNHFQEIGLDPAFRVADEAEIKLLQQEVLEELLEAAFEKGEERFLRCVEVLCPGGKESALEKHILDLSRYAASFPWPRQWLLGRKQDYSSKDAQELMSTPAWKYMLHYVREILKGCYEMMDRAHALTLEPDGPYMYGDTFERELDYLEGLTRCETPQELFAKVPGMVFDRLPGKKDDSVSPAKKEYAKQLRDDVKKVIQELGEQFFSAGLQTTLQRGLECDRTVDMLIDLVLEFDQRMKEKKQEKKMIDFSDMEHFALDILLVQEGDNMVPGPVAKQYREYFKEILVDEYQDSNLVQEFLLQAVSGEDDGIFNRFMVGDVKQSIYRFRLARPELFLEKYHTYGPEGSCRRVDLSKNFRSRSTVVNTVNSVFSVMMSEEIGGIAYDENAALYAGASYPECEGQESELLVMEKPGEERKLSDREAEALGIADKIRTLMQQGKVTDKDSGQLRQVRYKDIVILLRSLSGWGEDFKKVLEEKGIPAYVTSKSGYFDASEVQTVLNYLRILDNPLQDIPLYGTLKSCFGLFTEEEIATLRSSCRDGCLYRALLACDNPKAKAFLQRLENYREMVSYLPVRELIARILEDYDYLNYVTALPGGSKRRANVEMLLVKAGAFAKTSYFGLFHFIRYMEQLEKYEMDYGEADTLDENADVVRIMSIHKSKGLEFPIVFVSGMAKGFNMQDVRQAVILDMDLGLGMDFVDPVARLKSKTLRKNIIAKKLKEDTYGEELRLLYVALTRPKEKLILTTVMENPQEALASEIAVLEHNKPHLSYLDFMKASCFMDFLLPVLQRTDLQVCIKTMEELAGEEVAGEVSALEAKRLLEHPEALADFGLLETLEKRFSFEYPHRDLEGLYTKTTVTELKHAAMEEGDEAAFHAFEEGARNIYVPTFAQGEETVTGTVRGNAYHRTMELMEFHRILYPQFEGIPESYEMYVSGLKKERTLQALQESLTEQKDSLRLKEEYYSAVKPEKIWRFLQSPLGYRMWKAMEAGKLYREQPFVLSLSAKRLKPEFPEDEKVLIQGIIDVFFEEDGEIVLLDYKTDSVPDMESLWNRYRVQLEYYQEALERLTGKKVKEMLLYSFHLDIEKGIY